MWLFIFGFFATFLPTLSMPIEEMNGSASISSDIVLKNVNEESISDIIDSVLQNETINNDKLANYTIDMDTSNKNNQNKVVVKIKKNTQLLQNGSEAKPKRYKITIKKERRKKLHNSTGNKQDSLNIDVNSEQYNDKNLAAVSIVDGTVEPLTTIYIPTSTASPQQEINEFTTNLRNNSSKEENYFDTLVLKQAVENKSSKDSISDDSAIFMFKKQPDVNNGIQSLGKNEISETDAHTQTIENDKEKSMKAIIEPNTALKLENLDSNLYGSKNLNPDRKSNMSDALDGADMDIINYHTQIMPKINDENLVARDYRGTPLEDNLASRDNLLNVLRHVQWDPTIVLKDWNNNNEPLYPPVITGTYESMYAMPRPYAKPRTSELMRPKGSNDYISDEINKETLHTIADRDSNKLPISSNSSTDHGDFQSKNKQTLGNQWIRNIMKYYVQSNPSIVPKDWKPSDGFIYPPEIWENYESNDAMPRLYAKPRPTPKNPKWTTGTVINRTNNENSLITGAGDLNSKYYAIMSNPMGEDASDDSIYEYDSNDELHFDNNADEILMITKHDAPLYSHTKNDIKNIEGKNFTELVTLTSALLPTLSKQNVSEIFEEFLDSEVVADEVLDKQGLFKDPGGGSSASLSAEITRSLRSESNDSQTITNEPQAIPVFVETITTAATLSVINGVGIENNSTNITNLINGTCIDPEEYVDVVLKLLELLNLSINHKKLDLKTVDFVLDSIKKYESKAPDKTNAIETQISDLKIQLHKEETLSKKLPTRKWMLPPESVDFSYGTQKYNQIKTTSDKDRSRPEKIVSQIVTEYPEAGNQQPRAFPYGANTELKEIFRYVLPKEGETSCRDAFLNLIQVTQEAYSALAQHQVCSGCSQSLNSNDYPFNPYITTNMPPKTPEVIQSAPLSDFHFSPDLNLMSSNLDAVPGSYGIFEYQTDAYPVSSFHSKPMSRTTTSLKNDLEGNKQYERSYNSYIDTEPLEFQQVIFGGESLQSNAILQPKTAKEVQPLESLHHSLPFLEPRSLAGTGGVRNQSVIMNNAPVTHNGNPFQINTHYNVPNNIIAPAHSSHAQSEALSYAEPSHVPLYVHNNSAPNAFPSLTPTQYAQNPLLYKLLQATLHPGSAQVPLTPKQVPANYYNPLLNGQNLKNTNVNYANHLLYLQKLLKPKDSAVNKITQASNVPGIQSFGSNPSLGQASQLSTVHQSSTQNLNQPQMLYHEQIVTIPYQNPSNPWYSQNHSPRSQSSLQQNLAPNEVIHGGQLKNPSDPLYFQNKYQYYRPSKNYPNSMLHQEPNSNKNYVNLSSVQGNYLNLSKYHQQNPETYYDNFNLKPPFGEIKSGINSQNTIPNKFNLQYPSMDVNDQSSLVSYAGSLDPINNQKLPEGLFSAPSYDFKPVLFEKKIMAFGNSQNGLANVVDATANQPSIPKYPLSSSIQQKYFWNTAIGQPMQQQNPALNYLYDQKVSSGNPNLEQSNAIPSPQHPLNQLSSSQNSNNLNNNQILYQKRIMVQQTPNRQIEADIFKLLQQETIKAQLKAENQKLSNQGSIISPEQGGAWNQGQQFNQLQSSAFHLNPETQKQGKLNPLQPGETTKLPLSPQGFRSINNPRLLYQESIVTIPNVKSYQSNSFPKEQAHWNGQQEAFGRNMLPFRYPKSKKDQLYLQRHFAGFNSPRPKLPNDGFLNSNQNLKSKSRHPSFRALSLYPAPETSSEFLYQKRFMNPAFDNYYMKQNGYMADNLPNSKQFGVSDGVDVNNSPTNPDVIELTYVINRPPPMIFKPLYYVKYRIPYRAFVANLEKILHSRPYLRTNPDELYSEVLSAANVTDASSDLNDLSVEELKKLVSVNGTLTKAKLINQGTVNVVDEKMPSDQNVILDKSFGIQGSHKEEITVGDNIESSDRHKRDLETEALRYIVHPVYINSVYMNPAFLERFEELKRNAHYEEIVKSQYNRDKKMREKAEKMKQLLEAQKALEMLDKEVD